MWPMPHYWYSQLVRTTYCQHDHHALEASYIQSYKYRTMLDIYASYSLRTSWEVLDEATVGTSK